MVSWVIYIRGSSNFLVSWVLFIRGSNKLSGIVGSLYSWFE
jgi:hypothetical protein